MNTTPILSISILASDRPDTLPKCLASLDHLRQTLPCELILTDTDAKHHCRHLLEQYADRIIDFQWCNDFAKARNAGLQVSTGQWFMFLDDDEWFIDTSEIEKFFLSGEYKDYDQACYYVRNYQDYSENYYTDSPARRLFLRTKDGIFKGRVHEYYSAGGNKICYVESFAKHFGYVFDTEQKKIEHAQRNISLNVQMMEEEPEDFRWYNQLVREYFSVREYHLGIEVCEKGITALEPFQKQVKAQIEIGGYKTGIVYAWHYLKKPEKAINAFETLLTDKGNRKIPQAYGAALVAEDYFDLKKYNEALACCLLYSNLYDSLGDERRARLYLESVIVTEAFDDSRIRRIRTLGFLAALQSGNSERAEEFFLKMGWENPKFQLYEDVIPELLSARRDADLTSYCDEKISFIKQYKDGIYKTIVLREITKSKQEEIIPAKQEEDVGKIENMKEMPASFVNFAPDLSDALQNKEWRYALMLCEKNKKNSEKERKLAQVNCLFGLYRDDEVCRIAEELQEMNLSDTESKAVDNLYAISLFRLKRYSEACNIAKKTEIIPELTIELLPDFAKSIVGKNGGEIEAEENFWDYFLKPCETDAKLMYRLFHLLWNEGFFTEENSELVGRWLEKADASIVENCIKIIVNASKEDVSELGEIFEMIPMGKEVKLFAEWNLALDRFLTEKNAGYDELFTNADKFSKIALEYFDQKLGEDLLTKPLDQLPAEAALARVFGFFGIYIQNRDYTSAMKMLKSGIGILPEYDETVVNFAHKYAATFD